MVRNKLANRKYAFDRGVCMLPCEKYDNVGAELLLLVNNVTSANDDVAIESS